MMEINIKEYNLFNFISLKGDLDLANSYKLKDTINSLLHKDVKNIIIDFKDLKYIDSSGIGALLRINSQFNNPGKRLWLINIIGQVYEIIKLARLYEYFPISTLKDAIEDIKKNVDLG